MDPLYDDPDARPRRLAVLAGFGIITATGFATIAAMALDTGAHQQDTALPDSVITTSSSTPPGDSVHFRTADKPATDASRPESSRGSPAESSGRGAPEDANSATGEPTDTGEPGDHPAPGDSGDGGNSGDDGGGVPDEPSQDLPPPGSSAPEDSDEQPQPPPGETSESSTPPETSTSESTTPSSPEGSSSQAASSGLTSTGESSDRETTA
ncbi:hypothetical protein FHR84_001206 [Actinopolyspora biskrensis]|uniref:Uncharacterized protein n=1 Tax=Actinopolyspora biskrensis TaxID=1470178 RepID=A0A852YRM0_9ACTN|nr:hypothetical protein [Actinopolyspora biskrensis]NYH77884.1 hypothetical protein [Actinopolyspora biskrensis]